MSRDQVITQAFWLLVRVNYYCFINILKGGFWGCLEEFLLWVSFKCQRALKGMGFISLPADGTASVITKRLLALSALFRWVFFHLTRSSLMKRPFFPSVPCSRSPTYSSISSAFSMDRMYLDSRGKTWVVFVREEKKSFLAVEMTVSRYICGGNMGSWFTRTLS